MEIGESLVGAYMRQVRRCETVAYNTRVPGSQAELDVIGVKAGHPVQVWMAEAATHLDGLNYGGYAQTVRKVKAKVVAASDYARRVYPDADARIELWSPIVPRGLVEQLGEAGLDELIVNATYTNCIRELAGEARKASSLTGDDAFRMLQLLTRLRGEPIHLGRSATS
jgi:hypothetical protein